MFNENEGSHSDDLNLAAATAHNNDNVPQNMSENHDKQETRPATKVYISDIYIWKTTFLIYTRDRKYFVK